MVMNIRMWMRSVLNVNLKYDNNRIFQEIIMIQNCDKK